MGVDKFVGERVDTTRIHAAAAPVAGSGKEAHTKRDDTPILQGLVVVFRVVTSKAIRLFRRV